MTNKIGTTTNTSRSIQIPLKEILDTQYMGLVTEDEKSKLERKTIFFPKAIMTHIMQIVRDERFEYGNDLDTFLLHAVWLLLEDIAEAGYPDKGLVAELARGKASRLHAYKARVRKEMREDIHQFDEELEAAMGSGIPDGPNSIMANWAMWRSVIADAPTEVEKNLLRNTISKSGTMRRVIARMMVWEDSGILTKEQVEETSEWAQALEDWGPL